MRRITLWLTGTVMLVVLLFTYRTSTSGPAAVATGSSAFAPGIVNAPATAGTGGTGGNNTTGSGTPSPGTTSSSSPSTTAATTTVNGQVADTRWGPVQVQVLVSNSKIIDVVVLQQPSGSFQDQEINGYALPLLRQEVLQAQSAQIDGISGATVTSDGYIQSLQSALALVHIGG
jgi:uncharacterized protein with FMN-binding domain